jgi:CelD/BcsL family acetyltransferase involved in cellulose biosynthesis
MLHGTREKTSQNGTTLLRLTTVQQMAEAEGMWRALDAQSDAQLVWFQSFEWCYRWMLEHGGGDCTPLIFMLVANGEAVSVLPLMRAKKRVGIVSLRLLGAPHSQYANVLTRHGRLSAEHQTLLRQALQSEIGADQLLLDLVPDHSPLIDVLPHRARVPHFDNEACQLDLSHYGSASAYETSLGKKTSRNLRRSISQFEQAGSLQFEVLCAQTPGFAALVAQALSMKEQWLAATGRVSHGLEQDGHAKFLASLRNTPEGDGPLAFVLWLSGKPVAIELGYLQRRHYYAYIGAFDWTWRNLSPGKLQMHKSITWLIENNVATLDLLGNPSDYKQHYASHNVALHGYAIDLNWRGQAYNTVWTRNAKPQLKSLYHMIPGHVRSSLNVMRKIEYGFLA